MKTEEHTPILRLEKDCNLQAEPVRALSPVLSKAVSLELKNNEFSFVGKSAQSLFKCIDKKNTVDVIAIYLIAINLATIPYTKWCKKQLVTEAKP